MKPNFLGLGIALVVGLAACDSRNATDLNRILVPALVPDSFNPVETLDREPGGGETGLEPARDGFSQTTLRTGQVLIAGGGSGGYSLASAVIYDQRSAEFSAAQPMAERRRGHTATLIRTGDVVVLGGIGPDGEPIPSGEVYRSSTGIWERTPDMDVPRHGHTATLLWTGDILVVGGITSSWGTVTGSCEVLDTSTLLFSSVAPGSMPRAYHTATSVPRRFAPPLQDEGSCLDGNTEDVVVVAGGLTGAPEGPVSMMALDIEVYFPAEAADPWQKLNLVTASSAGIRWGHQAHLVGCDPEVSLVLLGGIGDFVPPLAPGDLEDSRVPLLGIATLRIDLLSLQPFRFPRGEFTAEICAGDPLLCPPFVGGAGARSVLHGGKGLILYVGGNTSTPPAWDRGPYSRAALVIDPVAATVLPSASQMSLERSFFGVSLLPGPDQVLGTDDDTALISGGEDSPTTEVPYAEEYAFP
jgi:hypothetical protein